MAVTNFSCSCSGGIGNIGVPPCINKAKLIKKDIFFNTYALDGTRNSIKFSDLVDGIVPESFLLAKLNEDDPSKRWYITPDEYEEAAPSRTDRTTQESNTGTTKVLRSGQLNRSFELWEVPHSWAAQLNRGTCNEVSVLSVDEQGNLVGEVSEDGSEMYGLPIQKGTLFAESFEATADKDAYTMVTYQISRLSNEGLYLTLSASTLGADIRRAKGLIEFDLSQDSDNANTATEIFVDTQNITVGTFNNYYKLRGATGVTDWKVYTSSGVLGTEILVNAVEEIREGVYKLTLDTNTSTTVFVSLVKKPTRITEFGSTADQLTLTKP